MSTVSLLRRLCQAILCLGIVFCSLWVPTVHAQFTTPTVNGAIGANEYGTHTDGQNQQSNSAVWYMTWDNTNLYIGINSANRTEAAVIYLDRHALTPINGGTNSDGSNVGNAYDNTNFAELPFRADLVLYVKHDYREYRTANGSNGWSTQTSGFGSYSDNSNNLREVAIPWSAIGGRPASFAWFGYVTSSGGFVYGQVPAANGGGSIGTSARYSRYYVVNTTADGSATKPFARESYVFTGTADASNFGSISVWDFTMNTSGRSIFRDNNTGAWTVNGNMVIANGTVNFGNGVKTTSVGGNLVVTGGTIDMGSITTALNVTGSLLMSSGTLALSSGSGGDINIGGDWIRSGGTCTDRNRAVGFTGGSAQSLSGNETFPFLTINKSAGTLSLQNNITVSNTLTLTQGIFSIGSNVLTLQGNTTGAGTLSANSGTVSYTQTTDGQSIIATAYNHLTLNNQAKTFPSGTVSIAGTFTAGTATHTYTGSTIVLNGGAQNVPAQSYNNLTIDGSATTKTLTGTTVVGGTLALGNNLLQVSTNTLTLNGNVTYSNATPDINAENGTMILGSSFQQNGGTDGNTTQINPNLFTNATLNNCTIGNNRTLTSNLTVNGTLTLNGSLNIGTSVLSLGATGTLANETNTNRLTAGSTAGYVERSILHTNGATLTNIAGMGITVSSAGDLGTLNVRRYPFARAGVGTSSGLGRNFRISPQNSATYSATLTYFDSEIGSLSEPTLKMYSSADGASWSEQSASTGNAGANTLTWSDAPGTAATPLWLTGGSNAIPTYTWNGANNGDWNISANWTPSNGALSGEYPGQTTPNVVVVIGSAHTINNVTVAQQLRGLSITAAGTVTLNSATAQVVSAGEIIVTDGSTLGIGTNTTLTLRETLHLHATGSINLGTQTLVLPSALTITSVGGRILAGNNSTVRIDGAITVPMGIFNNNTVHHLIHNVNGTVTVSTDCTVSGLLTFNNATASNRFDIGNTILTLAQAPVNAGSNGRITASGASTVVFSSPFTIPANVFANDAVGNFTHNAVGTITLGGSLTVSGALTFANATASNRLSIGNNTLRLHTLPLNTPANGSISAVSGTIEAHGDYTIAPTMFTGSSLNTLSVTTSGTITLGGDLTVNTSLILANGTLSCGANATITMAGSSVVVTGSRSLIGTGGITFTGGGVTTVSGTGTLTAGSDITIRLARGVNFGAGLTTIAGNLDILSGGYIDTNPPLYADGSTLRYASGGTYGAGAEWTVNQTSGAGVPSNVWIQTSNLTLGTLNNQPRTLRGTLTIGTGGSLTLSSAGTNSDLYVNGNFLLHGAFTGTGSNARAVFFNGTGTQIIGGSATPTFAYFIVNKASGIVQFSTSVTVLASVGDAVQLLGGNIDLGGNTLNIWGSHNTNTGGILVNGGERRIEGTGTISFSGTASQRMKQVNGTGTLVLGSGVTATIGFGGMDFGVGITTIAGRLRLLTSGYVVTGRAPAYADNSTLEYAVNYTASEEWYPNVASGAGSPFHVEVAPGVAVGLGSTTFYRQARGSITVPTTSTFTLSSNVGGDLRVGASLTLYGTFNSNTRSINFVGNNAGTLTAPGAQMADVTIDNGTRTIDRDVTVASLTVNAGTINLTADQVQFSGNLAINGGTLTPNTTMLRATGAQAQTVSAGSALSVANMTIDKAANALTLQTPLTVSALLHLVNGRIVTTTTNILSVSSSNENAITRTLGFVQGPLRRTFPALTQTGTYLFPVGQTVYRPITVIQPTISANTIIQAEVVEAPTGGTPSADLTAMASDQYWRTSLVSGTLTNTRVRFAPTTLNASTRVAQGSTQTGQYEDRAGTMSGTDLTSGELTALGFFTSAQINTTITTTASLTAFGTVEVGAQSSAQSYTVQASRLPQNLVITAPTGFQVSLTENGTYASSLTLAIDGNGMVPTTTVWARFIPVANGTASGSITHSGGGTTANVFVRGIGGGRPSVSITTQIFSLRSGTTSASYIITDEDAGSVLVTATSGNTTLLPNANISFSGSGGNRTITLTPTANQTGTAIVSITLTDNTALTTSTTLTVVVTTPPTMSTLTDRIFFRNTTTTQTITITDEGVSSLVVSSQSSNTGLLPVSGIAVSGSGLNRTLTLTPTANATGVAAVTVVVSNAVGSTSAVFNAVVSLPLVSVTIPARNKMLMQGFWWDYWNATYPNAWANYLADLAPRMRSIGIDAVWIPPVPKSATGTGGVGYSVFDHYDLGDKFQKGNVRTRMGTKDELLRMSAVLKSNGMDLVADIVLNHVDGAGSDNGGGGQDPQAMIVSWDGSGQWKNFRYSSYGTPSMDQSATDYLLRSGRWSKNWPNFHPNQWRTTENDITAAYWGPDISYDSRAWGGSSNALFNPNQYAGYMRTEARNWMIWLKKQVGIDGFRFDAVKHFETEVAEDVLFNTQTNAGWASGGNDMFAVGEWVGGASQLDAYANAVQNRAGTFDFELRSFHSSGGLRGMVYGLGNFNMALIAGAQQSNRQRTVPFVNNHDTFRPGQANHLEGNGDYKVGSWSAGSELAANIDPREPRLAIAYAVICAVDGSPQIFFEDLFDVGTTGQRYSHDPKNSAQLPMRSDIANIIWAHQRLGFKAGAYKVRSAEGGVSFNNTNPSNSNSSSGDLLIIERSARAVIGINDHWTNWQSAWVNTDFAPGTVLKDYSGASSHYLVVPSDGRVNIVTPPCNGSAPNGRRGYAIWGPVGHDEGAMTAPQRPTTQEWELANDLGDNHPLSLRQGGALPANSTAWRTAGRVFTEANKPMTLEVFPTASTQTLVAEIFNISDNASLATQTGTGTLTITFTPTTTGWRSLRVRNHSTGNPSQSVFAKVTYTAPAEVPYASFPLADPVLTSAPTPADLVAPVSVAGVALSTTLTWRMNEQATHYRIVLSTNADFSVTSAIVLQRAPLRLADTSIALSSIPLTLQQGTTYFWRVESVNTQGTSTSQTASFMTIGATPAVRVVLTTASLAVQAGSGLTIQAQFFDTANVLASTQASISFNGVSSGTITLTATGIGQATATIPLTQAGVYTLAVPNFSTSMTVTVLPASAARTVISVTTLTLQAGISQTIQTEFFDVYNNRSDTQASISFSGTSSGTIGLTRTSQGVSSASIVFTQAGTYTLTISNFATSASVIVQPFIAVQAVWSGIVSPVQTGIAQTVQITFRDAFGNAIDTQASISFSGTSSGTIGLTRTSQGVSSASVVFTQAGTYTLTIPNFATSASIIVQNNVPNSAVSAVFENVIASRQAGIAQTVQITFRDAFGNGTDTQASISFSGTSSGTIGLTRISQGVSSASVVFTQAGTYTLTIPNFATSASVAITPSSVAQMQTTATSSIMIGATQTLGITLRDAWGNMTDMPVSISTVPGSALVTLGAVQRTGQGTSTATFRATTIGTFTVQWTAGSVSTQQTIIVIPSTSSQATISVQPTSVLQGETISVMVQYRDGFGNPADPVNTPSLAWSHSAGSGSLALLRQTTGVWTATFQALLAGTYSITETIHSAVQSLTSVANPPRITSVQPSVVAVGGELTIMGSGLLNSTVQVAGVQAQIRSVSAVSVVVQLPQGILGNEIVIATPFGTTRASMTVIPAPTLLTVIPNRVNVGSEITLTGTNLQNVSSIRVGGIIVQPRMQSTSSIVVVVPSGMVGVSVEVQSIGGIARLDNALSLMQARLSLLPSSLISLPQRIGRSTTAQYVLQASDVSGVLTIALPVGIEASTNNGISYQTGSLQWQSTNATLQQEILLRTQRTIAGTEQFNIRHVASGTEATLQWTVQTLPENTLPTIEISTEPSTAQARFNAPLVVRVRVRDGETSADQLRLQVQTQTPDRLTQTGIQLVQSTILNIGTSPAVREWIYRMTPERRANGTAQILFTADDGEGIRSTTLTITVENVADTNRTPRFTVVNAYTLNQNASEQSFVLTGVSAGNDTETAQTLTFAVQSSDTSLIPNPRIVYQQGASTAQLLFTPLTNVSGECTLRVVLRDNGGTAFGAIDSLEQRIVVTILPNKPIGLGGAVTLPPFTAQAGEVFAVSETPQQGAILRFASAPPSFVQALLSQSEQDHADESVSTSMPFDVHAQVGSEQREIHRIRSGAELFVRKQAVVPFASSLPVNIHTMAVQTDQGMLLQQIATDTLRAGDRVTRAEMQSGRIAYINTSGRVGRDVLSFAPVDNTGRVGTPIRLTMDIVAENATPTISGLRNAEVQERTRNQMSSVMIPLIVSDRESTPQSLIVRVTSSNVILLPNSNISITQGIGGNRIIEVIPAVRQFGSIVLTITVSDGQTQRSEQILLTVRERNTSPVITAEASTYRLLVGQSTSAMISFSDADGDDCTFRITSADNRVVPLSSIMIEAQGTSRRIVFQGVAIGTTQLLAMVSDGRMTTTATLNVIVGQPTSIRPVTEVIQSLQPNPARDMVQIVWQGKRTESARLTIVNVLGQAVQTLTVERGVEQTQIDVSRLSAGTYRVMIEDSRGMTAQALVVVR